jgi:hypothetical protein
MLAVSDLDDAAARVRAAGLRLTPEAPIPEEHQPEIKKPPGRKGKKPLTKKQLGSRS